MFFIGSGIIHIIYMISNLYEITEPFHSLMIGDEDSLMKIRSMLFEITFKQGDGKYICVVTNKQATTKHQEDALHGVY